MAMAAFEYRAIDGNGRICRGVISADSAAAARRSLRRQHLSPLRITAGAAAAGGGSESRLGLGRRIVLTRQMAMMIRSGTPVEEALAIIGASNRHRDTRLVLASVRARIIEGSSLARALDAEPRAFPSFYRAAVRAGESAGALDRTLEDLAVYMEKNAEQRRKLISVLIYPIVLALIALSVALALLVLVVPQLADQLLSIGQELPVLTRMMLALSGFLVEFGLWLLLLLAVLALFGVRALRTEPVRRRIELFLLSVPVLGNFLRDAATARLCRSLATLARSGAPIADALAAVRGGVVFLPLRDAIDIIARQVREGIPISAAMAQTDAFPPLAIHMIRSGENSGNIDTAMEQSAEYLEDRLEATSNMALALLEPAITLFMGVVVLLIILSIMLPILRLNSSILA